jgi:hypothetical protein
LKAQSLHYITDRSFGTSLSEAKPISIQIGSKYFLSGTSNCPGIELDKSEANCTTNFRDIWVIALDDSLNKVWDKTFGGNHDEEVFGITSLNNNIVVSGKTRSDSSCTFLNPSKGNFDYFVIVVDTLGNKLNEFRFGSSGIDDNCKIISTLDNRLLLIGNSSGPADGDKSEPSFGYNDFWAIKIDSLGNKNWDKIYGGSSFETIASINEFNLHTLADSSFLFNGPTASSISGNITSNSFGDGDGILFKIDKNGNIIWDKRYGGLLPDRIADALPVDNYYYLLGYTYSTIGGTISNVGYGGIDIWLMKTDTSGNLLWERKFGTTNDEISNSIYYRNNKIFILANIINGGNGSFPDSGYGGSDCVLMVLDTSGNMEDYLYLGASSTDNPFSLLFQNDSTMLVCANAGYGISPVKHDIGKGSADYWVVKIGYSTTTSLNDLSQNLQLHIQPNPAHEYLEITGLPIDDFEVNIYSIEGRLLSSKKQHSDLSLIIPISSLQNGMYLTEIRNEKLNATVKWVKE